MNSQVVMSERGKSILLSQWEENEARLDVVLRDSIEGVTEINPAYLAHALMTAQLNGPVSYTAYSRERYEWSGFFDPATPFLRSRFRQEIGLLLSPYETPEPPRHVAFRAIRYTPVIPYQDACSLVQQRPLLKRVATLNEGVSPALATWLSQEIEQKEDWADVRGLLLNEDSTRLIVTH